MIYNLRITEEPPVPPADADFLFVIDFEKAQGNPRRVFDAASRLIQGFEIFDQALATTIDKSLEPVLVLEDVDHGSLKVWLKNVLRRTEDEALRTVDWKPIIGRYLVKAKYILLEFCDSDEIGDLSRLEQLKLALKKLAEETDLRHLPDYPLIHEAKLVNAITQVQQAKEELGRNDTLRIESDGRMYQVNLTKTGVPPKLTSQNARTVESPGEMILTVRKPDLLKDSMWQFVHGKSPLTAAILDESWMDNFRNRMVPIFPGDALRCKVLHTYGYDESGKLESDKIDVIKILEVIKGPPPQDKFL